MKSSIQPVPIIAVSSIKSTAPVRKLTTVGHQFFGLAHPPPLTGKVELLPEPQNPVDSNAVLVLEDDQKVGYISKTSLHWVHAILSGHLSTIREFAGAHVSEMSFPLLVSLVEPDALDKLYGCLFVVGIADDFSVSGGECELVPLVDVERYTHWAAVVSLADGTGEPVSRKCEYKTPVSEAIVRAYLTRKGWSIQSITAANV